MKIKLKEQTVEQANTLKKRLEILKLKASRVRNGITINEEVLKDPEKVKILDKEQMSNSDLQTLCEELTGQTISKWMSDEGSQPRASTLEILTKVFNVSVDWLLAKDDAVSVGANDDLRIFRKYGFSDEAFLTLSIIKDNDIDMNKLMHGLNALLSHRGAMDSIKEEGEKWAKTLYALSEYFSLYENGKSTYIEPSDIYDYMEQKKLEDFVRITYKTYDEYVEAYNTPGTTGRNIAMYPLLSKEHFGKITGYNDSETFDRSYLDDYLKTKEPHQTDAEALITLEEVLKQCKARIVKAKVQKLVEEYNIKYKKYEEGDMPDEIFYKILASGKQYHALIELNKFYNNIEPSDLKDCIEYERICNQLDLMKGLNDE